MPPAFLGGLSQLEDHGERGLVRQAALHAHRGMADRALVTAEAAKMQKPLSQAWPERVCISRETRACYTTLPGAYLLHPARRSISPMQNRPVKKHKAIRGHVDRSTVVWRSLI